MTPAECKVALKENVAESIHYALDLKKILDDERSALERKDTTSLNDAAVSKQICVDKLNQLDQGRKRISRECGFAGDAERMTGLLDWCDEKHEVAKSWEQFLETAETCSNMNAGNGAIIRVRQAQVKDAIGLLREGTTDTNTYGPTGQDAGELRTRSLAEA